CDIKPERDMEALLTIKTLGKINDRPAKLFLKEAEVQQAQFVLWCKQTALLPANKQVEAVAAKLKERNPAFDGKLTSRIEGSEVIELPRLTYHVTDLWPLRALTELRLVRCAGSAGGKGKLLELSPLRGSKLATLQCPFNPLADLTALRDVPLTSLDCASTDVAD